MTKDRNFKGVWIPKEVWLSKELTIMEKLFLVEINSLDNSEGCYAGNGYFSEFFELSKTRVSVIINSLVGKGYISSTLIYKEGTKQILKRVLKISKGGYIRKQGEGIKEKFIDNSTVNNTVNSTVIITMPPNKNLVEDCLNNCLKFFPKHLHPKNKNTWLDTIEKLNRIDGIPFLEIERIVKAVREDPFWGKNFLSMTKLRKKKDEVYYIVIFGEKFKPKEKTINRQTEEVIKKNLTGWGKKQNYDRNRK